MLATNPCTCAKWLFSKPLQLFYVRDVRTPAEKVDREWQWSERQTSIGKRWPGKRSDSSIAGLMIALIISRERFRLTGLSNLIRWFAEKSQIGEGKCSLANFITTFSQPYHNDIGVDRDYNEEFGKPGEAILQPGKLNLAWTWHSLASWCWPRLWRQKVIGGYWELLRVIQSLTTSAKVKLTGTEKSMVMEWGWNGVGETGVHHRIKNRFAGDKYLYLIMRSWPPLKNPIK